MIKVGIIGAAERVAGELIRILVNHPDVDIVTAYEPQKIGHAVSSVHHGLIGEISLDFSGQIDPSKLDVVFICTPGQIAEQIISDTERYPDLKVIDLTGNHVLDYEKYGMVYGLSEINRKPMVRGAARAVVPSPIASAALIALAPLAVNAMLSQPVSLRITLASDLAEPSKINLAADEIAAQLRLIQDGFEGPVKINLSRVLERRGMRITTSMPSDMTVDDIERLYESIYDDHNFTFLTSEPADFDEIEGTDKCLISLTKPGEEMLAIDVVADSRMRGGAGEAVHVMNLLFGLHERTGLALKASTY